MAGWAGQPGPANSFCAEDEIMVTTDIGIYRSWLRTATAARRYRRDAVERANAGWRVVAITSMVRFFAVIVVTYQLDQAPDMRQGQPTA